MRVDDVGRVAQQLVGNVAGDLEQRCIPFEVREAALMVTEARGGEGCLREFLEAILRARGEWERAVAAMGRGAS